MTNATADEMDRAIRAVAPIQAYLEAKHGRRMGLKEAWDLWGDEAEERFQVRQGKILVARQMALMAADIRSLDAATLELYRLSPSDLYEPPLKTFEELFPGSVMASR